MSRTGFALNSRSSRARAASGVRRTRGYRVIPLLRRKDDLLPGLSSDRAAVRYRLPPNGVKMFSHVVIGVVSFGLAYRFCSSLAHPLGLRLKRLDHKILRAVWSTPDSRRPYLIIRSPSNLRPPIAPNRFVVGIAADRHEAVDQCHRAALETGGICEGKPGPRPEYHAGSTVPIFATRRETNFVFAAMPRKASPDRSVGLPTVRFRALFGRTAPT